MKRIIIILCLGLITIYNCTSAQDNLEEKRLKVIEIKEFNEGFVITGFDLIKSDSIYFVSVKDPINSESNYIKIQKNETYLFEIIDVDKVNGKLPAALPNGYFLKFGNKRIKRTTRNGKSINSTQYFARNTKGLFIEKESNN